MVDVVSHALVGLLPVLLFLLLLVWLDSYKLVAIRVVVAIVVCGVAVAVGCSYLIGWLIGELGVDLPAYARYVAPVVDAGLGTWIVRGFGTAVMHGGVTAIFAMMSLAMLDRVNVAFVAFVPALALAIALHAAYNYLVARPLVATIAVIVVLPALMAYVFQRSERAVGRWLGRGFDADTAMLASITSGRFADSPSGRYLESLRSRFKGPVVADLLCYLRLHTELALRAKGVLMMRENGFDVPLDDATRDKFAELDYLEGSIGKTGLLALKPMLHMSHRDLWQLHVLGK